MTARLVSIQYARAIAALMVVVYHTTRWAHRDIGIGAAGVDVFFVISGFILWTITADTNAGPLTFLKKRAARVVPLYWTLTLAVTAWALIWPGFFFDAIPSLRHVVLSLAFIQHFNQNGAPFPLISAGWSLNYEAVFYLLFAASLLLPKKARYWSLCALVAQVPFWGWALDEWVFNENLLFMLGANFMAFQFLAGLLLAGWIRSGKPLAPGYAGWVLIGAAALAFAFLNHLDLFQTNWRPFAWGGAGLALVTGLLSLERAGRLPSWRWLGFLGDASYSIYLSHLLMTEVVAHLIHTYTIAYIPVALAASIAAGVACHLWIERPLLVRFRKTVGGPSKAQPLPAWRPIGETET